ncbi:MAG: redoxin domain-containing protein [Acidobacteriota bacterium]|nr:redoxin domain-containing protein [Acidobacteriota bacterium]
MRRRITALLTLFLLAAASVTAQQAKPAPQPGPPPLKFKVGDTVPDFTLKYFDGTAMKDFSLHDYKGKKNVLVAFFIFAFTGG